MKIALLGYGKMGKEIEQQALAKGHEIVLVVDEHNASTYTVDQLSKAEAAIEFSTPHSAVGNIYKCFEANVPVVVGTTGWLERYEEVKQACLEGKKAFLFSSNYSIGVNIFFEISRRLAAIMNQQPQYNVRMEEIHHTQKLDAPSGTAITLAEDILSNIDRKSHWICQTEGQSAEPGNDDLLINALRIPNIPGTHTVSYDSEIDSIEIKHTAHNRKGFAAGALMAAEWIAGKKGVFSMRDILKF